MNEKSGDALAVLIGKRYQCLQQLHQLGQRQAALIDSGELGSLLRVLSAKNQLIAALQAIEGELQPYHEQDPDSRNWDSPVAKEQCAEQVELGRALLEEIMAMERENEQKMVTRRDQVAEQLQSAQTAGAARRAYQAQQTPLRGPHGPMAIVDGRKSQEAAHQLDLQSGG